MENDGNPTKFWLIFTPLHDKIHNFYPILFKLAQTVCINVRIDSIENEENPSNIMGKGPF